ncbi:MAG: hypothetical protein WC993_05585 [Methanoculleus sp.]
METIRFRAAAIVPVPGDAPPLPAGSGTNADLRLAHPAVLRHPGRRRR